MTARTLLLPLLFAASTALAQDRPLRVGLLRDHGPRGVLVMSAKGNCTILADGVRVGELPANDGLRIDAVQGGLTAKSLGLSFTAKKRIDLVPRTADGGFRLRVPERKLPERRYAGKLEVSAAGGTLLLVNSTPLEPYVAGVVQSEAGRDHHAEYYKLQSVSCRTYALSNQRKHLPEGFDLCDGTHCQVYRGLCSIDSIRLAAEATHGLVLVDAGIRLIHATFHSNCGGETVNAEDIWSKSEPYLRATTDTFCLAASQATWKKTLPREEWLGYLRRRHNLAPVDDTALEALLDYEPGCRDLYLGNTWPLVPLKQVRADLKLRSTFFAVRSEGDRVVLEGRGFGHGVGLCQEGAMRMARAGRSYTDILHHYYTGVHLVDISNLDFFRDDGPVNGPTGQEGR